MADVAAIFHWSPAAFVDFSIEELMDWRALAIERAKLFMAAGKGGQAS